jgi:hypothetical protein
MWVQVYNKIDQLPLEEVDRLARQPNSVVIRWGRRMPRVKEAHGDTDGPRAAASAAGT